MLWKRALKVWIKFLIETPVRFSLTVADLIPARERTNLPTRRPHQLSQVVYRSGDRKDASNNERRNVGNDKLHLSRESLKTGKPLFDSNQELGSLESFHNI